MKEGWLVFEVLKDGPVIHYNGPDKATARVRAAKGLASGKAEIFVARLRNVVKLSASSMQSVLPRTAF